MCPKRRENGMVGGEGKASRVFSSLNLVLFCILEQFSLHSRTVVMVKNKIYVLMNKDPF